MAKKGKETTTEIPTFSEADMARARQWFKRAADNRERRDYDYAIECYIGGLDCWSEAVEEGHMPLRSLAIQRQQAGGKKPGLMDTMRKSMTGKDVKKAMLNAEHLLSMDPQNISYAEGLIKNAAKGSFLQTCQWAAPIVLDLIKKEKKANKARFQTFRQVMIDVAETADNQGEGALETFFLEHAVDALEFIAVRNPTDEGLKTELRSLAGRLTIARGKYDDADTFRDSLRDADKQKLLHDSERVRQGEQTYEALVAAARKEYEEEPTVAHKINAFVEVLLKAENKQRDEEALKVLQDAFAATNNYSFKMRADDVKLRQLRRQTSQLVAKAKKTGNDDDKQQARLAAMEWRQTELDIYRERVAKYPTDLRLKFKLGSALFESKEYDEAIPVLQAAQQDPRTRAKCQLLLGQSFYEKNAPGQAVAVLKEALDKYEMTDEHSKALLYWLGRSLEANGQTEEAKDAYGRLLRQDYNYRDGDARKRLEGLN